MAKRRKTYGEGDRTYSADAVQSFVIPRHMDGMKERDIIAEAAKRGMSLKAGVVKHEVRQARSQGRLHYQAGRDLELAREIEDFVKSRGRGPLESRVVDTLETADVAHAAADWLAEMISREFRRDPERTTLHIGFAGGLSPCLMARRLADLLADRRRWDLPQERPVLVFHALVGSMNLATPRVDPNAFLIYLAAHDDRNTRFDVRFNNLPAPGLVTTAEFRRLRGPDGDGLGLVRSAMKGRDLLNFLVFSCGHWGPGHQSVFDYIDRACTSDEALRSRWMEVADSLARAGVIGDVMWTPLPAKGRLRVSRKVRLFGMFDDIFDLLRFMNPPARVPPEGRARGPRNAILLAGPCTGTSCRESKGAILASILGGMSRFPMTHLVADTRSASDALTILAR